MLLPFREQIQIWSQCHGQGRRPAQPARVVVGETGGPEQNGAVRSPLRSNLSWITGLFFSA